MNPVCFVALVTCGSGPLRLPVSWSLNRSEALCALDLKVGGGCSTQS